MALVPIRAAVMTARVGSQLREEISRAFTRSFAVTGPRGTGAMARRGTAGLRPAVPAARMKAAATNVIAKVQVAPATSLLVAAVAPAFALS